MKLNIDQLKKKIVYRSNYRGTKEMDKLLGAFTDTYIDEWNIDDNSLYSFYNGLKTDIKFEENNVNYLFRNFKYTE